MTENEAALVCRALSDANRLRIIKMLSEGEKCGCKLLAAFQITQPTLSHHMKILCGCGLVKARRQGKWTHYSLCCETLAAFKGFISSVECPGGQECKGDNK